MEIYGQPSDGTARMFKNIAASGVAVSFRPRYIGGILRLTGAT